MLRPSGSEVMGLMDASCCLAPTGSSLEGHGSGPSSSQPFFVLPILYHVRVKKSNVFLAKMQNFFLPQKQAFHPAEKHKNCLLTNRPVCALMAFIHSIKTLTEILLFSEVPESRYLVRAGADERMQSASRVGPVNGASSVMGPGGPRYRDRTCWSLKGSPYGR